MTAAEVLARIRVHGGDVVLVDGAPRLRAPEPLPDDLVGLARQHKDELVALLAEPRPVPYLDARGDLVIPFDSPQDLCWWKGGRSIADTLDALSADEETRRRYTPLH